jgi:hypothetical protein
MQETGPSFEERKWAHEQQVERSKWIRDDAYRAHDKSIEFHTYVNQAAIDGANLALRTLIIINGGAAVAVLAFIGAVASKDKIDLTQIGLVAHTLRYFAAGVACAAAAMALAYFTHFFAAGVEGRKEKTFEAPYVRETPRSKMMARINLAFHVLAFVSGALSLTLFIVGMWTTSDKVALLIAHKAVP